jgi:hypothetical protein
MLFFSMLTIAERTLNQVIINLVQKISKSRGRKKNTELEIRLIPHLKFLK